MDHSTSPDLWLRTVLLKNGIPVADAELGLLGKYVDALIRANQAVNLISRRDEQNVWQHHILHSLSILFLFRFPKACRVLDLGSGGGLPGIPLKIMVPSMELTMVDSTKKKISSVEEMIADLRLDDIRAVWARAEDLGQDRNFKEQFDIVVARAVGPLNDLARFAYPFLRKTERGNPREASHTGPIVLEAPSLLAYKGGSIESELEKTRRIQYVRSVQENPLVFDGSHEMALEDKKIVIVQFT